MDKAERLRDIARYKAAVKDASFHSDGYRNMLNKVGMSQDNSTAWSYMNDGITSDMQLAGLYADNGLFAKIIDRPAEDALSKGLDLSDLGEELEKKVKKKLNNLEYTENMILAEKWSRLFGGAIAVMLINDGGGIDEPLNLRKAQGIEEIRVFERAIVQPDYTTLYQYSFFDVSLNKMTRWGEPQWYYVYSNYGQFRVHASRCLVFRNGNAPEYINNQMYRFWGIPTYDKIKTSLRETITSHHDGTKLLERSVLGVYKMRNLSNLLASDEGEDKVIQRLQVIDEGRNIINSMAIDAEGEDYSYINASMAGASDIIDRTCNMLSAVTDIPQTILFGKSPSGMDATGEHDMENYYQMLSRMQARDLQKPTEVLVKLILLEMIKKGELDKELPEYEVRFNPLKEMSEEEEANLEATKAGTDMTKAQTAQIYVDMQALDPTEVRKALKQANDYEIQGIIDEDAPDELEIPDDTFDLNQTETENPKKDIQKEEKPLINHDYDPDQPRDKKGQFAYKNMAASVAEPKISGTIKKPEKALVDYKAARVFTKEVKGTKTQKGNILKSVSAHAAYRMKERGYTSKDIIEAVTGSGLMYPGNKSHPDATCYQHNGMRLVVSKDGVIVSSVRLEDEE